MNTTASEKTGVNAGSVVLVLAGLAVLTLLAYSGVFRADFVSLDDPLYVTENTHVTAGLRWAGVVWAFTTGHAANWHPITWLSHMTDVQLFGMNATAHHAVNLLLHVVNALLLFVVLRKATGNKWASAFVAALFALHPLHVESVAWVAERKDVLSTLFWMLTLLAYTSYVVRKSDYRTLGLSDSRTMYVLVIVLLALGLMAKPMLVTVPLVLLLIDAWPLKRHEPGTGIRGWVPLVREKLPLFALAAASSIITFVVQQRGGAVSRLGVVPLATRIANALVACVVYMRKMVWPTDLSPFYTYPASVSWMYAFGAAVLLVAISLVAMQSWRRRPYLAIGWFWYLITLAPVLGVVQVGRQAMADRYTYVPLIGLFIIVAWGAADLLRQFRSRRIALPALAAAAILLCTVTTYGQVGYWHASSTLWQRALELDPDNYFAHNSLGAVLSDAGQTDDAIEHFTSAARLAPDYPEAHANLGLMFFHQDRLDEAVAQLREAVRLNPDLAEAHNTLGRVLAKQGNIAEASSEFERAVSLSPDFPAGQLNLGKMLFAQGQVDAAIEHYLAAARLDPLSVEAHDNLGTALAAKGRFDEAVSHSVEAIRLRPGVAATHHNYGRVLAAQGRTVEAMKEFQEAVKLDPDLVEAHMNLAALLASRGSIGAALSHYEAVKRLQPSSDSAHLNVGLALAALGKLDDAIVEFKEALRLNPGNESAKRALGMAESRLQPARTKK